ncbi:MAG TPA: hypothetical protein VKG92_09480 [Flavobacteriales bacterium]|nr:hypothetical protein [Flavobacteriales bacterium]
MNTTAIQQALFKQVKERMPQHVSLPEELASMLGISADSAYRRIRGEKTMDLGELVQVCSAFSISLDTLMGNGHGRFLFTGRFVGEKDLPFAEWLTGMNTQLEQIAGAKDAVFVFRAEDIPSFHYFLIPELTQFKLFFWRRTILDQPDFQARRFSLADREEDLLARARKTFLTYARVPSTEIWNADSLNAFLRQISFYRDAGLFAKEEEAQVLFDKLLEMIAHLQAQAEAGVKFLIGEPASTGTAPFKVYVNEVMQGDNMIYASAGGQRMVFLNHSAINFVSTMDEAFCDFTQRSIETITRRSMLISGTGERERNRYFRDLRAEVERRRR